jgi:DNA-binding NarL/FixJ family response regulator
MIKVLLVEDRKMSRDSIISYIKGSDRYELAAQTPSAGTAEMLCMQYHIDLVLMDVCTANNEDGIEAAAVIKRHFPRIKVIIITGMTTIDLIKRARAAKADSFWYKEIEGDELLDVMERTMNGEHIYPNETPIVQIGNMTTAEISEREFEVLRLMVDGNIDAAIAEKLCVSVPAVRYHITQLLQKTGYENRVKLIADLINKDFIVPGL